MPRQTLSQTPQAIARRKARREARQKKKKAPVKKEYRVKEKKPKEKPVYDYMFTGKQDAFKHDVRSADETSSSLLLSPASDLITLTIDTTLSKICSPVLAYLLAALNRGWGEAELVATKPETPAYAYKYICELMSSYLSNGAPLAISVPRWFNILLSAVAPTKVRSYSGNLSYSFKASGSIVNQWEFANGPSGLPGHFTLGVRTQTSVNTYFSKIISPDFLPYTDGLGAKALESAFLYMENSTRKHPMHEMVPFSPTFKQGALLSGDTSAFAQAKSFFGGGYDETGSLYKVIYSETPTDAPLFSCFNVDEDLKADRMPIFMRGFSTDGLVLGGLLTTQLLPSQIKMKRYPIFKHIDIMEYVDTYARVLVKAATLYAKTPAFRLAADEDIDVALETIKCPISFQEFTLCIRATVLSINSVQHYVQGIYPSDGHTFNFTPLSAGIGTMHRGDTTSMLLPNILKENMLANSKVRLIDSRGGENNPSFVIPVYGAFENGTGIAWSDYKISYQDGDEIKEIEIFPDPADLNKKERHGKTKKTLIPGVDNEEQLSVIDGSKGSSYYDISSPAALSTILGVFNAYISGSISECLRRMSLISSDQGASVFRSIGMTRHIRILTGSTLEKKIKKEKEMTPYQKRYHKVNSVSPNIYNSSVILSHTSNGPIFKVLYTSILQYFVMAINQPKGSGTPELSTDVSKYRALTREFSQIRDISDEDIDQLIGENPNNLADLHDGLANLCVKSPDASESEMEAIFNGLNASGEASIIAILSKVFHGFKATQGIVQSIRNLLK